MPRFLAAAAIVIAGLVTYANSFTGVFIFDDRASIVDNPYVRNPEPWAHPLKAMLAPRNVTVSGRPVASFSFALNYALAMSGIGLRSYLVGTLVGLPLPIALYCTFFDVLATGLHVH